MAIQSDHEFAPTQIARAVFPTAFRGYDQDAVRRYLSRLAAALEHQQEYAGLGELEARTPAHERVEELEGELEDLREEIRDLELELVQRSVDGGSGSEDTDGDSASESGPESVAFDEHRAIELLGQETARVLESARSAAADILKRAETQAASLKTQAKSELAEARRRAESIVSDSQTESEQESARMADEARSSADQVRSEAEEHRSAVLEESSKILTEAEQLAEAEQAQSEERAKQIVADAETLRQQVISELVSEQRQATAEMDRMTAARDRLALSLAVARSELDEVADALVDASAISVDSKGSGRVDAADQTHEEQVNNLVVELEAKQAASPPGDVDARRSVEDASGSRASTAGGKSAKTPAKKRRGKRRQSSSSTKAAGSETGSTTSASSKSGGSSKKSTRSKSAVSESDPARIDEGDEATDPSAAPIKTGSALFEDAPGEVEEAGPADRAKSQRKRSRASSRTAKAEAKKDNEDESADEDDTVELIEPAPSVDGDRADDPESSADGSLADDGGLTDDSDGTDPVDGVDEDEVDVIDVEPFAEGVPGGELNTPPADGQELTLVEGFTTIELNDPEIDLRDGDDGSRDDDDRELVTAAVGPEYSEPEELITTVSSRTASAQRDRTRGDLLIEEPYTGRLAKEFAARDVALTRSGPNFRRQLRRALNDDQSDVLDRLRAGRGEIKVDELPAFADQIDRYLAPLRRGLAEIAQAGAKAGGQSDLSQTALDNLVRQLAKYIVDKVRMPTIDVIQQTTDHDRERILEPVRALYRDFRNVGLSELTEDALYEAFAIGLYDSIEPSAPISWVIDPRSDPDPVCDINSQRDDVVKGVVFPSGHARPLSLPGCRCLVMVSNY